MARQRKTLPARRRNAMDDSLLIRSAESLGRVIGSLQRQLEAARQVVSTGQVRLKAPAFTQSATTSPPRRLGAGSHTTSVNRRVNGQASRSDGTVKITSPAKTKTAAKRKAAPRLAARARSGGPARKQSSMKRRSPKTR